MFSGDDQAACVVARRAVGFRVSKDYVTPPVRTYTAGADLVVLHQMLNGAATVRVKVVRMFDGNPLAGIRRALEQNPRRPMASNERFTATHVAIRQLSAADEDEAARTLWTKIELALVLPK